jgi:hypothetical protein
VVESPRDQETDGSGEGGCFVKLFNTNSVAALSYHTSSDQEVRRVSRSTYGKKRNMVWGSGAFNSCDKLLERVEKNDPTLVELVILPMKSFGAKDIERLSNAIGKLSSVSYAHVISCAHGCVSMRVPFADNVLLHCQCVFHLC